MNRRTNALVIFALLLPACGGHEDRAASAPPSSAAEPSASLAAEPLPAVPPPSPGELARRALQERRYEEVCGYLVTLRFSPEVCSFIAQAAGGARAPVPEMDAWLESQRVRFVRGAIVGPHDGRPLDFGDDRPDEIDVLVSGEPVIVGAMFLREEVEDYLTVELWAQQTGSRAMTMGDGRIRSLPVYREWPLRVAITDLAQTSDEVLADAGRALLEHLLGAWETSYAAPSG